MKLSVLDQSVSVAGSSEDAAIRDTLDLAQHCERLGYSRFWVSEHHGLPTIIGSAPEILMAAIAARTTRIRIGSAGVMLPHYSALKVAEQFRVLEALAPACRTLMRTSSSMARGQKKRSRLTAGSTSRARATPSRTQRCASGRWPPTRPTKPCTTRSAASAGAWTAPAACSGRCNRPT